MLNRTYCHHKPPLVIARPLHALECVEGAWRSEIATALTKASRQGLLRPPLRFNTRRGGPRNDLSRHAGDHMVHFHHCHRENVHKNA